MTLAGSFTESIRLAHPRTAAVNLLLIEGNAVSFGVAQHAAQPWRRRSVHKTLQILDHVLDIAHLRALHGEHALIVDARRGEIGKAQREHHLPAGKRLDALHERIVAFAVVYRCPPLAWRGGVPLTHQSGTGTLPL